MGNRITRDSEVHSDGFDDICLAESGRELFASAVSVFLTLDPAKLIEGQKAEFEDILLVIRTPKKAPLLPRETVQSVSDFFPVDCVLYFYIDHVACKNVALSETSWLYRPRFICWYCKLVMNCPCLVDINVLKPSLTCEAVIFGPRCIKMFSFIAHNTKPVSAVTPPAVDHQYQLGMFPSNGLFND